MKITEPTDTNVQPPKESPRVWDDLLFNLILPILVLDHLSGQHGFGSPLLALFVALSFPIYFSVTDFKRKKRVSLIAGLGLTNTLVTGGFALFSLSPFWFAFKEAVLPTLIGVFIGSTLFRGRPAFEKMLEETGQFNFAPLRARVTELGVEKSYGRLTRLSTGFFALSFLCSGAGNYFLARHIFQPIDPLFTEAQRQALLNSQISTMNWRGFLVLALPSMVAMFGIMYFYARGIHRLTGLSLESLMMAKDQKSAGGISPDESRG